MAFRGCRAVIPISLVGRTPGNPSLSLPSYGLTFLEGWHTVLCWRHFCRASLVLAGYARGFLAFRGWALKACHYPTASSKASGIWYYDQFDHYE